MVPNVEKNSGDASGKAKIREASSRQIGHRGSRARERGQSLRRDATGRPGNCDSTDRSPCQAGIGAGGGPRDKSGSMVRLHGQ